MTIANGAQHSLHFVAESSYGTTPSTPTWTPMPHTGTTLALTKDAIESEKLRSAKVIFSTDEAKTLGLEIDKDDSHAADPSKKNNNFALLLHDLSSCKE